MPSLMELVNEHESRAATQEQHRKTRAQRDAEARMELVRTELLKRIEEFVDLKFTPAQVHVQEAPRARGSVSPLPNQRLWVETEGFYFSMVCDTGSTFQDHEPLGPDKFRTLHVGVACPNGHVAWSASGIDSRNFQKPTRESVAGHLAWAAKSRDALARSCEQCQKEGRQKTLEARLHDAVASAPRTALAQVLTEVLHGSAPESFIKWTEHLNRVSRDL